MARVLLRYPNACTEGRSGPFTTLRPLPSMPVLIQEADVRTSIESLMLCEENFVVVLYFITEYLEESQ